MHKTVKHVIILDNKLQVNALKGNSSICGMDREPSGGVRRSGSRCELALEQFRGIFSSRSRELAVKTGGYAGIRNECAFREKGEAEW